MLSLPRLQVKNEEQLIQQQITSYLKKKNLIELPLSYHKKLTNYISSSQQLRCVRCWISLSASQYKDVVCYLSTSKNRFHGNKCVKCALNTQNGTRYNCTIEDFENYLQLYKQTCIIKPTQDQNYGVD